MVQRNIHGKLLQYLQRVHAFQNLDRWWLQLETASRPNCSWQSVEIVWVVWNAGRHQQTYQSDKWLYQPYDLEKQSDIGCSQLKEIRLGVASPNIAKAFECWIHRYEEQRRGGNSIPKSNLLLPLAYPKQWHQLNYFPIPRQEVVLNPRWLCPSPNHHLQRNSRLQNNREKRCLHQCFSSCGVPPSSSIPIPISFQWNSS